MASKETERLLSLEHDINLDRIDLEKLEQDDSLLDEQVKRTEEESKSSANQADYKATLEKMVNQAQQQLANERVEFLNVQKKVANEEYLSKLEGSRVTDEQNNWSGMKFGIFTGCWMTLYGFIMWRSRVQKYQDFLLKKEAESKGFTVHQETVLFSITLPKWFGKLRRRIDFTL
jgi:hypothetical protein